MYVFMTTYLSNSCDSSVYIVCCVKGTSLVNVFALKSEFMMLWCTAAQYSWVFSWLSKIVERSAVSGRYDCRTPILDNWFAFSHLCSFFILWYRLRCICCSLMFVVLEACVVLISRMLISTSRGLRSFYVYRISSNNVLLHVLQHVPTSPGVCCVHTHVTSLLFDVKWRHSVDHAMEMDDNARYTLLEDSKMDLVS